MRATFPTPEVSAATAVQAIGANPEATGLIKYNSIDILRLLCAIMVVAIHTEPLTEYSNLLGFIGTFIFPRLGVPFFFAVSGYFYINSLLQGKKVFLKYLKRLLTIYSIWSLIYYTVDFLQVMRSHNSLTEFVKRSINNFFLSGSHYQLWFFPALIFCVVVVTLFRKRLALLSVISFVFYGIGCLLGAYYYKLGSKIPFIDSLYHSHHLEIIRRNLLMGLPFFLLGYILIKIYPKLDKIKSKALILAFFFTLVLYLAEIFTGKILKLQSNIVMTVFLYPLLALVLILCLRFPLSKLNVTASFCKVGANFMYYSHPLYMFIIQKVLARFFSLTLSNTLEFLIICSTTVISAYIIFRVNNSCLNKLVQ